MRILYYTYSLPVGGAETIVTEYLQKLKERGHEVSLVQDFYTDSFLTRRLRESGIPIYTLWKGNAGSSLGQKLKGAARAAGLFRRFNRVLRRTSPDIVHLHGCPDHMDKLDFPPNRIFYTFHSELHRNLRMIGSDNQARLQALCDRGATLSVLTEHCARECRELFHTDRVLRVPNGVDFGKVRKETYDRDRLEALFGIPKDRFLVGTLGRLDPVKNHERMISIFRAVKTQCPEAALLIVGGDRDGRMKRLKALAEELGIGPDVYFTGQRQDGDAILAAMDRFLLTSKSESFSLVTIEAQALGVPCVVSDAVPEEVACKGCTRMPLAASDEAWAKAILAPASDQCIGKPEQFDLDTVIGQLEKSYREKSDAIP